MTRCPTCRAPYRSGETCYRCGTGFSDVLAIEREAASCVAAGCAALEACDLASALGYADRALHLHRSEAALHLGAVVAIATKDFPRACALWREARAQSKRSGA